MKQSACVHHNIFFLITCNGSLLSCCRLTHIIELFHSHPEKKIDCKLFKAVLGKWVLIQFSPQSYKRVDGIRDDISKIIKKNNDRLSLARYARSSQLQHSKLHFGCLIV